MTSPASSEAAGLLVAYEGPATSFEGLVGADFFVQRPHHARLECNLQLAFDARAMIEAKTGPLGDAQLQALLRALATWYYGRQAARGAAILPIVTLRAADLPAAHLAAVLTAAGLA